MTPVERMLVPFNRFVHTESSGGLVLMACALLAMAWANSPWAGTYFKLWNTRFTVGFGEEALSKPLLLWINDGLMAIFFFLVGLEIKREILVGELNSLKQALLPIGAAVGGMAVPALIYFALNPSGPEAAGWGIPMATDIAFALGILSLLGSRVPVGLKVFLTAVAIVDDMGAVLVIALFYTAEISMGPLWCALGLLVALLAMNRAGVRCSWAYALVGAVLWLAFLKSGVHATIAGVLTALTIPSQTRSKPGEFMSVAHRFLEDYREGSEENTGTMTNSRQQAALDGLSEAALKAETPLQRIEHALHPWVAFCVMPIFALANAGVVLSRDMASSLAGPMSLGVILGLIVGKQVGITLAAWLTIRFTSAEFPEKVGMGHIYGASWLAGIGFTMSIFISGLAFGEGERITEVSKLSILCASALAGVCGYLILKRNCPGDARS